MKKKGIIIFLILLIIVSVPAYAKTNHHYHLKFHATGGSKCPGKISKSSNKNSIQIQIPKTKPKRKGYVFLKWNTKQNGSGTSYKPGGKIKLKSEKPTVTLYAVWKKRPPIPENSRLEIYYIDVGQGDCTLIGCDGEWMLVDAGENDKGTKVVDFIRSKKVKSLKYVVGTHPDADHIGGLDDVINNIPVQQIFMPKETRDCKTYKDVTGAAKRKSIRILFPLFGSVYRLGNASFKIVSTNKSYVKYNDMSISFLLTHGYRTFLFIGDAETESETDMVHSGAPLKSDVYKVAHHGGASGSIPLFLNKVKPAYGIISCGYKNDFGHPHKSMLNRLKKMNMKIFRTDIQGTISLISDGMHIKWNTSPTTNWTAGIKTRTDNLLTQHFILDLKSEVFHKQACTVINKNAAQKPFVCTRIQMITSGYIPCKVCSA